MASPFPDMILESENPPNLSVEQSEAIAIERPKIKGRAKLLQGLQRISSSPSLAQLGRRRATSNPYTGRGSLSCVSLASGSSPRNYDNSYSSQSAGYSTAPTTPGVDSPSFDGRVVRKLQGSITPGTSTPTSALPIDIRPQSRGLTHSTIPEILEDYFSQPIAIPKPIRRTNFDFWGQMPHEIKLSMFAYLTPKELVRASIVSKSFYKTCFDGQLWTCFDA